MFGAGVAFTILSGWRNAAKKIIGKPVRSTGQAEDTRKREGGVQCRTHGWFGRLTFAFQTFNWLLFRYRLVFFSSDIVTIFDMHAMIVVFCAWDFCVCVSACARVFFATRKENSKNKGERKGGSGDDD